MGSFNLVKYIKHDEGGRFLDYISLWADIFPVVRAMDNIVDRAIYPLPQQKEEAQSKRRMGIGFTGVANAIESLGYQYGTPEFLAEMQYLFEEFTNRVYLASTYLAEEKGSFPLFDTEKYVDSIFIQQLRDEVRDRIIKVGIRNSHLTSIAPTGTISLCADNVSSGIEPTFSEGYDRTIQTEDGPRVERVDDYGVRNWGLKPRTADQVSVQDHVKVLLVASKWMDSAVSKTCNVGDQVTWQEFKDVYIDAWKGGAKGCTTFRASGKRYGILNAKPKSEEEEGSACYIDTETGKKTCE